MIQMIGWIWWLIVPVRKRMAIANYRRAFPERSPAELRQTVGEMVWGYIELAFGKRALVHGAEHIQRGGICLAGHGGAWDLGLISAAEKIPTTIFVKTPTNPLVAWWITRLRKQANIELLPPSNSAVSAYRALKRGRLVVFVQDQRYNTGISVSFFGQPAWTSRGFAVMATRTQVPTYGAWQWRDAKRGIHHIQIEPLPIENRAPDAEEAITQQTQLFYEEKIRTRPHSWLWLHNRWRPLRDTYEQSKRCT